MQQGATNSTLPPPRFSGNGSLHFLQSMCVCAYNSLSAKWIFVATIAYIINCLSLGFKIRVVLSICSPQRESGGEKRETRVTEMMRVCVRFLCISGILGVSFSQSLSKASL